MFKVLLLLALVDRSGNAVQVWEPVIGFETVAACELALKDAYADEPTNELLAVRGKCVAVEDLK